MVRILTKSLSIILLLIGIASYAINYQYPGLIPYSILVVLLLGSIIFMLLGTVFKILQNTLLAGLAVLTLGLAVWSGWINTIMAPWITRISQNSAILKPDHLQHAERLLIAVPAVMCLIILLTILTRPGTKLKTPLSELISLPDKPSKTEPDVILCKSLAGGKPVVHRWLDRCLHTMVVGPTGAGKTSRVLKPMIYQDIMRIKNGTKMSVILLEPKGDFAQDVSQICKEQGVPYYYINPESPETLKFNPLEGDEDTVAETTRTVLRNMFGRQEAFFAQAQETHAKMTVKLMKSIRQDDLNLLDLVRVLSDLGELKRCVSEYKNSIKSEDDLSRYFEHEALGKGGDKLQQFALGLRLQLGDITSNKLLQKIFIGKSDINLDNLLEQGGVFVVSTAMGPLGRLGDMFGAFVILHICGAVFRRPGNEFTRIPSAFYIDEFARYLNKDIERLLAIGRSYRCACIMAFQSVNQLNTDETRGFKDMILDIPRNLIVFGGIKAFDAKYFSEEFGEVEVEEAQKTYKRDALIFWRHDSSRDTRQFKRRYPYTYIQELPANRIIYRIVDRGNPGPPGEAIVERLDEQGSLFQKLRTRINKKPYKPVPAPEPLEEHRLDNTEQANSHDPDPLPEHRPASQTPVPYPTISRNQMPRRTDRTATKVPAESCQVHTSSGYTSNPDQRTGTGPGNIPEKRVSTPAPAPRQPEPVTDPFTPVARPTGQPGDRNTLPATDDPFFS